MRVLEPHYFRNAKRRKGGRLSKRRIGLWLCAVFGVAIAGYLLLGQDVKKPQTNLTAEEKAAVNETVTEKPKVLKKFSPEQFKKLYSAFYYPNTEPITTPPEITGNREADKRIRQVAEARGYRLSAVPVASIVKTGEPGLEGDDLIQPNAQLAWQKMKAAAAKDGVKLQMTSAYRSIEYQRALFLRRMQTAGVNTYTILDGFADDELDGVLAQAAIPGYSRHHTGYTLDLACNGVGLYSFTTTSCFSWLSKNNFANAKRFGWVPSYPEGATNQGPEPEPWEYIWVGTASLYE